VRPHQDRDCMSMHFSVYFDHAILIPNADFEELERINNMNKRSSNFRLLKNEFGFAGNTPNMR
jgi:hypothetical protein